MLNFLCEYGLVTLFLGIGATLLMDAWAWLQLRLFKTPSLNYALVGRWVGHCFKGRLAHQPIMTARPIKHERALGWLCHYLIGIAFAGLHLLAFGTQWLIHPTLLPALLSGVISLAAPFLILQPCLGFGMAASLTPTPWRARGKSLLAHLMFGLGLYLSALLVPMLP